jgi:adenylate kinase
MSISMTIALEVDENLLIDRLINRGKDSGRTDDQDKSKIQNRFDEYNKKTAPLIVYYKSQNKFFEIDGIGEINDISNRIFDVIDKNL